MILLFVFVVFLVSFLLASAAVLVANHFMDKREGIAEGTLMAAMGLGDSPMLLKLDEVSSITVWGNVLKRFDFAEVMRSQIAEADMSWSVGRLTALMLLIGAIALAILTGATSAPFSIAFFFGCGAALLPYVYVLRRRRKRFDAFEAQFPDALDFLGRSLLAGHPLPVCLELLAQEESAPLATEMRKTAEERRLGMQLDRALDNLAKRMPLINVRVFVAAVKMQSRTGGKLSEVLGGLAESMREASVVEGEVRALAAHGKVTGAVLTTLPILIAIMMTIVNPGYLNIIFDDPVARIITICCMLGLVAAHFVIRKIVDIKL
jgi:tight adherence protein B